MTQTKQQPPQRIKVNRVYLSAPMAEYSNVSKFANLIRANGIEVDHWIKGTGYGDVERNQIKDADAFVIILPGNKFKANINDMTAGIKSEIQLARANSKPVYLAYISVEGPGIYDTRIISNEVEFITDVNGIAGTRNHLFKENKEVSDLLDQLENLSTQIHTIKRDTRVTDALRNGQIRKYQDKMKSIRYQLNMPEPKNEYNNWGDTKDDPLPSYSFVETVKKYLKGSDDDLGYTLNAPRIKVTPPELMPLAQLQLDADRVGVDIMTKAKAAEWTWSVPHTNLDFGVYGRVTMVNHQECIVFIDSDSSDMRLYDRRLLI